MSMRDIQHIRLHNLDLLLQECADEIGRLHGAATFLADRTGVPKTLISMLRGRKVHSGTGTPRQVGDEMASKLEQGMGKPPGWMDIDHTQARDWREAAHLDKLRLLSPSQREAIERMLDELTGPKPDSVSGDGADHAAPHSAAARLG